MTILFAGSEEGDFQRIGQGSISTAASVRRSAYVRAAVTVNTIGVSDGLKAPFAAVAEFWAAARVYVTDSSNSGLRRLITFYEGTTDRVSVRINVGSGGTSGTPLLIYVGSTLAQTTGFYISPAMLMRFDFHVKYAVAGWVKIYNNGTLVAEYTGDTTGGSGTTTLDNCVFGAPSVNRDVAWSECIIANVDSRNMSLATLYPSGAGNSSQWTGSYTDVDETTLDESYLTTTTANQLSQFTVTAASILTGTVPIGAVVVSARAQCGVTAPQNIQLNVRTGATDYVSSSVALDGGPKAAQGVWGTNPNTGVAWTVADLTAAGFNIGVKSIA